MEKRKDGCFTVRQTISLIYTSSTYNGRAVVVFCTLTDSLELKIEAWFPLESDKTRNGQWYSKNKRSAKDTASIWADD